MALSFLGIPVNVFSPYLLYFMSDGFSLTSIIRDEKNKKTRYEHP